MAALAPDDASLKAARGLASPRSWSMLGCDDRAIWGACQGSGKSPYLTQVDWSGPAFKCSCPSRKFPCKHGLALLLLLAERPGDFASAAAPEWVTSWIAGRTQRATPKEAGPVDEAARAKRAEQRASRVADGIATLDLWLRDLLQQGLASAPTRPSAFWDEQARRLVDAQAPGASRLVQALASDAVSGEGWQDRMLRTLARLLLLVHGYSRLAELPPDTQADLLAALGQPLSHAEVLASEPVRDEWFVAGQKMFLEGRLGGQRTWLSGRATGRSALLVEYIAANAAGFKSTLIPGSIIDASVCYFPGAAPLRALIKETHGELRDAGSIPNALGVKDAFAVIGDRLAANPWTEVQVAMLKAVAVAPGSQWMMVGAEGLAMPCTKNYGLLALSGGRAVDVSGEWNGEVFTPLVGCAEGRVIAL